MEHSSAFQKTTVTVPAPVSPTARTRRRFVEPRSAGSHLAIADATQKGCLDLPKFKEIRRWPQKHLVLVVGMVQVWSEFPVDPSWDRARVRNSLLRPECCPGILLHACDLISHGCSVVGKKAHILQLFGNPTWSQLKG